MSLSAVRSQIHKSSLWIYRLLSWAVLAAGLLFAATILVLRYWILPDIAAYRDDITQILSRSIQQRVIIGNISANWNGLRPQLALEQVILHDAGGRPTLKLPRIDATLSWRSVARLQVNFHSLDIYRPVLTIRRDRDGLITVASIPMDMNAQGGVGFSGWLLAQRKIEIHEARLIWNDELRAAPLLELDRVQLRIVNNEDRHRVALRALPPSALASPLDMRADLIGEDFQSLSRALTGQLYMNLDYVDLAAWRQWIDFPVHFPQGAGAMRSWSTFTRNELQSVIADVQLHGVHARLGAELPDLDMDWLGGRFSWKRSADGFEIATRKLAFTTGDKLELSPVDLRLQLGDAGSDGYARGELKVNALELVPLVQLADRLPLGNDIRKSLAEFAPTGAIYDFSVRWNGYWLNPKAYTVRGRFHKLSLARQGSIPGFSGFSGKIDGTEKSGTLHVVTQKATLDMPRLFREPLRFDTLNGQLAWSNQGRDTELQLSSFAYANADLAGTLFGTFRIVEDGPGIADLTGHLTRGVANRVSAYLPLIVAKGYRGWLDKAFMAGTSNDVRFRLRGNLRDFPFADDRNGLFEVAAKVSGGELHYGEGWPRITGIQGDLTFRGKRLEMNAREGVINNVRLGKVRAMIPDLVKTGEVLHVSGEAEGATADFLGFIEKSPVHGMINHFTEGMSAQGRGRLGLKLTLPLRAINRSKIGGTFQFINNRLHPGSGMPPLEQVYGRLEFTESSVQVPKATAVFLGGPLSVTAGSQRDAAVNISFQGRINADAVQRAGTADWARQIRGSTEWRGTLVMRNKLTDLVVDSTLRGLAVSLPAPLTKTDVEELPLRLERRFTWPRQEKIKISVGKLANAVLYRNGDGKETRIERGVVHFGEGRASEPDRPGVALSGSIPGLDLDGWLAFMGKPGGSGGAQLSTVDLQIGELEWFDRHFAPLKLVARQQSGALQINAQGRDIEGTATWSSQGKGRLNARLRRLSLPAKDVKAVQGSTASVPDLRTPDLPALDVVVDEFHLSGLALGRLELQANPRQNDWRIERLRVSRPEGTLNLDGVWQSWLTRPGTQVNVRLEVNDVGKFLARLGYPEGVRRGTAKVEGNLSWEGGPQRLDYPTLSGNFVLYAAKGQFVKLEPGIGKLLGILSLQSMPRRITLDFRDIFSEGLAFNEIVGAIKVNKGIATTESFRISGPAARVSMSGRVDLARETQSLRVKVNPQLSDTVSVAGALISGPVAGLAAFITQKLLKDPLDQIAAYEYDVIGSWSEPHVTKVEPPSVNSSESGK